MNVLHCLFTRSWDFLVHELFCPQRKKLFSSYKMILYWSYVFKVYFMFIKKKINNNIKKTTHIPNSLEMTEVLEKTAHLSNNCRIFLHMASCIPLQFVYIAGTRVFLVMSICLTRHMCCIYHCELFQQQCWSISTEELKA